MSDYRTAFNKLSDWCKSNDYAGYDPFDGLNSRIFQNTPFKYSRFFRLAWIQFFKRSPINFRRMALVDKGKNSKGIALFALSWLEIYRKEKSPEAEQEAKRLLDLLLGLKLEFPAGNSGISRAAFGYNFDWQGRAFYAPIGTPTVVPTAFAARALIEAYELFGEELYLENAKKICNFITSDLKTTHETPDEICFSYSPIDETRVFNASLLACEALAGVGELTGNDDFKKLAIKGANYVINRQKEDGSWAYGADSFQSWADNFHTAFNLMSLKRIAKACHIDKFDAAIKRGYESWIANFFQQDGFPKYFYNRAYPADCHSSAAAIACLIEFGNIELAKRVADWSIENLQDEGGFFYYQKKKFYRIKIPYMRWSNAWMHYALAKLSAAIPKK